MSVTHPATSPARSGFTATARRAADGLTHEVIVNGRHMLITDEPESLGGLDKGPAPHELLPAALAACISTTIAMYARTKGWHLADLKVDVHFDNGSTPRRFEIEIRLAGNLSDEQLARLTRVAETCPLRRSLEAGFEFDERIVPDGLTMLRGGRDG